jgi:hypothetical protein
MYTSFSYAGPTRTAVVSSRDLGLPFVLLESLLRGIFFALLLDLSVTFSNHKLPLLSETGPVARNLLVAPCKAVEEAPHLLSLQSHPKSQTA